MPKAKADNPTVEKYLARLSSPMAPLVSRLRETVRGSVPGLEEDIKWGKSLTYSRAGKNLIQTVVGKDKVTLIFFEGASLPDPAGLLEGDGKKSRSARFSTLAFPKPALRALVRAAAKGAHAP